MKGWDRWVGRTRWKRPVLDRVRPLLLLIVPLTLVPLTLPGVRQSGPWAPTTKGEPVTGSAPARWQLHMAPRLSGPLRAPPYNDVARSSILNVDRVQQELGLYGQGQIIAVADTGLDAGDTATLSADLNGRLREAFAWGRSGDWSDPNGHGTHVAGSAVGSGVLSGSDPGSHRYAGSFAGTAPEAALVFQSLLDAEGGLGGLPDDLQDLLRQAYDAGARVHSNSWGANFFLKPLARFLTAGRYTAESAQVDRFVWEHPDMVILFAAGNEGVDYFTPAEDGFELPLPDGVVDADSLSSPGTAKNVITVGASEGLRTEGGHATERWGKEGDLISAALGYSYVSEPIASDLPSDNADGMAPFSSHGPTTDGRIKPDVVAPGTNIISARSHAPGAGELFGVYDEDYVYCSGTSMSTPLVAGAVALIREWYVEQQGVVAPSAALIKATLINGTTDIRPGQFGRGATQDVPDAWPNPVMGWGRVNLRSSLPEAANHEVWFVDEIRGLQTGQEAVFVRYAGEGARPLRVTLVWSDPPGTVEVEDVKIPGVTERSLPVLVNDLDLTVEAPDGRLFYGNMGEGADRLNNVESARISEPPAGEYRVVVRGHQVPQGPQPFALVMSGQRVVSGPEEEEAPVDTAAGAEEKGEDKVEEWVIPVVVGLAGLIAMFGGVLAYLLLARRPAFAPASGSQTGRAYSRRSTPSAAGGLAGGLPAASLWGESGPLAGQRIPVPGSPFTIGRGAENDLVLSETAVSRQHARLEGREGRWFLYDLDSANGTFLNRQKVVSPQPLHSGDLIGIGDSVLLFTKVRPAAIPPQPPARSRRAALVAGLAVGLVLILIVVAVVLLVRGEDAREAETLPLPGLPSIELPTVVLPTVELPTVVLPTGMPTVEVPTVAVPTGMPTVPLLPTEGLPLPTGDLPLPPLPLPTP